MKEKRKKYSPLKKWAGKLHLWLGLASGIIVFIVAITGCIFVFHDEIRDLTQDWRKVSPQNASFVLPSVLQQKVKNQFPEADVSMVIYQDRERPAHIFTHIHGEPHNIFFNPYSGELLKIHNLNKDFFIFIQDLHMYLLLPEKIGRQVVGISTLIFILMLVTGIILWWPKKKKNFRKSLQIKWKARWRRTNYDLHKFTGVYLSLFALMVAITGLNFSYEWMHESIYTLGNLGKQYPGDEPTPLIVRETPEEKIKPIDLAFIQTMEKLPESGMSFVWEQGSEAPIVSGAYPDALEFDHQSNFYFHPQTGELLVEHYYDQKSTGLKLQEMSYGLHTGQYFGLTGKVIAFITSLFVASLPVTGVMIWWGRKKKSGKRNKSFVKK